VHQQLFRRIADGGALGFGINGDPARHVEIGRVVNKYVAVARSGLDCRDQRVLDNV
jgi:hypothetical protein